MLQTVPQPQALTSAILKVAAGTPVLAASLDPAAFLTEVCLHPDMLAVQYSRLCNKFRALAPYKLPNVSAAFVAALNMRSQGHAIM